MNAPAMPARPLRLSWPIPLAAVLAVLAVMLPLVCWCGVANPRIIPGLFSLPWTNAGGTLSAAGTVFVLLAVPLAWMLAAGRGDLVAIWLMQNAMLAGGYFLLPETAGELNLPKLTTSIVNTGGLVAMINALGFSILLVTLGLTYLFARLSGARLEPLRAAPQILDRRLSGLLRVAAVCCVGAIVLSMAVTHTIPMLAPDPETARYVFDENAVTRALFNANMAILPFVCAGLVVLFFRDPFRHLGLDGWLVGGLLAAEMLAGNRFPLAIAAMATLSLLSMEKRWPRWMLLAAIVGYCVLFISLSGFTSIWRQDREALNSNEGIVETSFRQAYLGNNLIDYRDAAWVFSRWDRQPLMGRSYLGGMAEMLPSGIFPLKKQWHLGQIALRMVGWGGYKHFGLRLSCFGESFLNFGYAGVAGLAVILGIGLGALSRCLHLLSRPGQPVCLARNLGIVMLVQMLLIWTNSADAYGFWALLVFYAIIRTVVIHGGNLRTGAIPKPAAT